LPLADLPPAGQPLADLSVWAAEPASPPARFTVKPRQRRKAKQRLATEELFAELATMAGIPAEAYSIGQEVDGALCLLRTKDGFEVFHASGGSRHEPQLFSAEEAACFYLFGVLVADAVRSGSLLRTADRVV
jgi:hypothetical protein